MNRSLVAAPLALIALVAGGMPPVAAGSSQAKQQILEYKVRHAIYGDIGTYLNIIESSGEAIDVRSTLRIAVRVLGLAMYREEAERRERWVGDRLVAFSSVTDKNGERIEVTGEARGDRFVITAPWGTAEAPPDVRPSNPWSAKMLAPATMMSTTTGRLFRADISGGNEETIVLDGQPRKLRQFEIFSDKREFVWLDDQDVPVVFGTEDSGARVEFVLVRISSGTGIGAAVQSNKLPPSASRLTEAPAD